ncbi:MAG TPA: peptidoglycan-binding domain-containing protein [Gemmatimonadales bacterium]|jgi:peptidoglycan hydrolase-like protein with peptidoglycan-binding domain
MRWTSLAIAVAVAACAKGERDQVSHSAADSATAADSAIAAAPAPADTVSAAATADTLAPKKSTSGAATATKPTKSGATTTAPKPAETKTVSSAAGGPTGAEALMGVRASSPSVPAPGRLSTDQVKRLQAALNKAGCHAGTPDGVEGAGTQRAIACAQKKYKLASDDLNGLYKKLGLDF